MAAGFEFEAEERARAEGATIVPGDLIFRGGAKHPA